MAKSIPRQTVTIGAAVGTAVNSSAFALNEGWIQGSLLCVRVTNPANTNSISVTVGVYDRNNIQLWTSTSLAANTTTTVYPSVPVPLEYGEYYKVTPSGVPGAGGCAVLIDGLFQPDSIVIRPY